MPIARQLESQAYLSQVQNPRKDIDQNEESAPPAELQSRFSGHVAPVDPTPPVRNNMDSFFRQAEEDERQRVVDSQNPTPPSPMLVPDIVSEIAPETYPVESQAFEADQTYVSPDVETPVVSHSTIDSFQQPMQPAEFVAAELQSSEPLESNEHSAPAQESAVGNNNAEPSLSPQAFAPTPPQQPVFEPATEPVQQVPAEAAPEVPEATQPREPRRLTGTAGLSAGLATAGMGALSSLPASQSPSENNQQQPPQASAPQSPLREAPSPVPRDQNVAEQGEGRSGGASANALDLHQEISFHQTQPGRASGTNAPMPTAEQSVPADNGSFQNSPSASALPSAPMVTGGFSGGFSPSGQLPTSPTADVSQAQDLLGPSAPENRAPTMNVPPTVQQTAPQQTAPQQTTPQQIAPQQGTPQSVQRPFEENEAENEEVEDARLAAMQQAQRIKAERAKALVDGPDTPARPYGLDSKTPDSDESQQTVLEDLSAQPPAQPPAQPLNADLQQQRSPAAAGEVQQQEKLAGKPIVDKVNEDGSAQRRPFPMELFNHNLLRNLRSGVVFVDHQRRVQLWSRSAETMTGIISEAVMDRPLYPQTINLRFDDGTGVSLDQCPLVQCLETMQTVTSDYRMLNAANQEVKIEVTIAPVIDEQRYVNGAILVFDDHSAEIDLQRQLKDLYEFSVLDPLTQVANRAEFERVLEEYVRAFNQSESFNCSIIICDIDFFKSINDNFGHTIGDQALVAFAEMLKKYVRSQDLVARYGGEEFVILCADCDTNSALQRAEQIRMGLFKTPQKMLDGKSISASFGVSELRQGDTAMEFFVRADTALLRAKETGRNRVVIADQREAPRDVNFTDAESLSGMQWRQQRREHTSLICEEFKTATPVPVLVEKLRGFIIEKDAWLQRVDQEFLSMEVDFEDPTDYSRKGSFTMNIEFKEGEDSVNGRTCKKTFIRVTIFPGRKKKWFSTNHTDVAPYLLSDLRSYLMINDEASHLSIKMATEDVRGNRNDSQIRST